MKIAVRYGVEGMAIEHITRGTTADEFEQLALERHRVLMSGGTISRYVGAVARRPRSPDITGADAEIAAAWALECGAEYDPRVMRCPWRVMRALAAGTSGGYLVSGEATPVATLRPYSVTARAGVQIVDGLRAGQTIAALEAPIELSWIDGDATAEPTDTTPTFAPVSSLPKLASGLVRFSRKLKLQTNIEQFLALEFLAAAGRAIDRALLAGSGISGEPFGILNTDGVASQSGTTFDRDDAIDMRDAIASASANDEAISFIGAPGVRTTLSKREVVADTGRYVWDFDRMADRAARVTPDMPTGTLIAGDWSTAVVALWGSGIAIDFTEMRPDAFARGGVVGRVLVDVDVVLPRRAAFVISPAVS